MPWRLSKHWNKYVWQLQFWLLLTIPSHFCWRLMHPKTGWGQCCPRSRQTDDTIQSPIHRHGPHTHEKNYHLTKLEFLVLKWAVTEHFKEYLLYQPFLVKTDNNPLTYIMTTPNLDAISHQWIGTLAWFNFKLKYQKGCDNTVVDVLHWVTTGLDPDMVRSILNGVAIGAVHWAKIHNPTIVEGDLSLEWEVHVATGCALIQMHVTDWAKAQSEDPMLSAALDWLKAQKKTDLKVLLVEHTSSKEGWLILQNQQNFMIHQGALYLHAMPKGKTEDILLFVLPKAHWVPTLNSYHRYAGHQGCNCTLSLLWECFWWLRMINQMQQSIKSCVQCWQHDSNLPKAPLHPILTTTPLDLLHVDFTSIEMPMELNKLPRVANVLVFQDHFMQHILACMTPDQTAKTIGKFLYQDYISIFGAPGRFLSDWSANFMSSSINKLCNIPSMKKLQTMPYHPQTNGLVERSHQTIMRMIGKLEEGKKANWPGHLTEIVHAYNATQSAVTGYSPHIKCSDEGLNSQLTFTSPPLGAQRPQWEVPPPSVWMNMWQLSVANWGPPSRKLRHCQQQKLNDRNGTMTEK